MKGREEVSAKSVGSRLPGHKKPPQKKAYPPIVPSFPGGFMYMAAGRQAIITSVNLLPIVGFQGICVHIVMNLWNHPVLYFLFS
ncbi:MAG: hypothetical protein EPO58_16965 [Chitinophagaceae bacterium]|nr:MAG: hypothetical protein EPO58_16965 [Chitinophagaceae bacterium]